ncbi:MAG: hypothetical protein U1A16_02995 [Patescibacteria group bacterium]|nr:hypothetical protein [Patescibacteria group bacterium]
MDLFTLASVALADTLPPRVDAAYLFGHSRPQWRPILESGLRLFTLRQASVLCLCGGAPYVSPQAPAGSPASYSFPQWRDFLLERHVPKGCIHEISRPELSHAGTEARNFVEHAKAQGWESACFVSYLPQALRAFANMVTWVLRMHPSLRIYAAPAAPPGQWTATTTLWQGIVEEPHMSAFAGEYERIERDFRQRDIVSGAAVLAWWRSRDAQA